jgi:hypothetical protein
MEGIAHVLIDAEMKMFQGLNTPVIFLQNVVTDLVLGRGYEGFSIFANHVKTRYNTKRFITMNLPRLLDALDKCGIDNPIVCSNINKIGFRMSGGIDRYEQAIATSVPAWPSLFACGAIAPAPSSMFAISQNQSIVFGASVEPTSCNRSA